MICTKRVYLETSSICVHYLVFYCWLVHRPQRKGQRESRERNTNTSVHRPPSHLFTAVARVLCCILLHSFSHFSLTVNCCIRQNQSSWLWNGSPRWTKGLHFIINSIIVFYRLSTQFIESAYLPNINGFIRERGRGRWSIQDTSIHRRGSSIVCVHASCTQESTSAQSTYVSYPNSTSRIIRQIPPHRRGKMKWRRSIDPGRS